MPRARAAPAGDVESERRAVKALVHAKRTVVGRDAPLEVTATVSAQESESACHEEPPWRSANVVPRLAEQSPLPVWGQRLFAGAWREELAPWPRWWSSRQVALLAITLTPKAAKVVNVIDSNGLDGALCLAGGLEMMVEKCTALRKADLDVCRVACRRALEWMTAYDVECTNYVQLFSEPHEQAMLREFAGSCVEMLLRRALQPSQPLYSAIEPKEWSVKAANSELQQLWGLDDQGAETTRVAAVLRDGLVHQNLVYVWEEQWWLVASVDFAYHGKAEPGHWHLNRTPAGDQVEHWGPRGDVFHGTCWNCPLWWLVIPDGMEYADRPIRLDMLPEIFFGEVGSRAS